MEPKRAILYARVSGDDRLTEGRNLRGQLDLCRHFALAQGWQVVAELAEDERGAASARLDLPQLNRIIDFAREGKFDVLVVRELDRLSRSLPKQLLIEELLLKAGVTIDYVLGAYPDTPEGNFMKNVRAAVAELEGLKIRERIERGKVLAVRSGNVRVGANPPYGYDVVEVNGKSILRIREDEAKIVRLIFDWYIGGDEQAARLSMEEIANRLTQWGVPTFAQSRQGLGIKVKFEGRWGISTIQNILKSTVYRGEWRYGKSRTVDGRGMRTAPEEQLTVEVPAIVDEATWHAAYVQCTANQHKRQDLRKCTFLLTGYIWCDLCGTRAFGENTYIGKGEGRSYRYYRCSAKSRYKFLGKQCHSPVHHAEEIDHAVWEWIALLMADTASWVEQLAVQQARWNERVQPIQARLEEIAEKIRVNESQQERLLELCLDSSLSKRHWQRRNDVLKTELRELTRERARCQVEVATYKVSEQQIRAVQSQGKRIMEQMDGAVETFVLKRQMLDLLNVRVRLCLSPKGDRYATASCLFGEKTFPSLSKYKPRKRLRERNPG